MESLATTNVWLAILAIVSLLEFLMIAVAGLYAYKLYRQVMTTIETVERVHIAPLRARVDGILDEVQMVTNKVKHAQESVSTVAGAVKAKTWPIIGVIQGVKSLVNTVIKNGKNDRPPMARYGT